MKIDTILEENSRGRIVNISSLTAMDVKPYSEQFTSIIELAQNIIKAEKSSLGSLHNRIFLPGTKTNNMSL